MLRFCWHFNKSLCSSCYVCVQ